MENFVISLSWSTSRGRDTYGYNICRLDVDNCAVHKRYRCMGGGYDMVGTVVGDWLQDQYQARLLALRECAHAWYSKADGYKTDGKPSYQSDKFYGMTWYKDTNKITLDGACGISCMIDIAAKIGVSLTAIGNRRGQTTGYMVTENSFTAPVV